MVETVSWTREQAKFPHSLTNCSVIVTIFLSGGLRWSLLRLRLMVVVSGCGFWRSRLLSSGLRWSLVVRNLRWRRMSWLLLG